MKPEWLSITPSKNKRNYDSVKETVESLGLHTVCLEARCPNISECWSQKTATFMVMGDICTRGCRFCAVSSSMGGSRLDASEPAKLAEAVKSWGLEYVVITTVCRDDLYDQGAGHFSKCVKEVRRLNPNTIVEVLIPDFQGEDKLLEEVVESGAAVVGHNLETVERLTPSVRDGRASYALSLKVLARIKELGRGIYTKSAFMLGLGENREEITATLKDLRMAGVDFLAVGQYLRPSGRQLEVAEYVNPSVFESVREEALRMGFLYVAAGPFVRSSYKAGEYFVLNGIKAGSLSAEVPRL